LTPLLLATALAPLLPGLIRGVEALFPPNTGATKLDVVAGMTKTVVGALATGGILTALPDDKAIRDAVEAKFAELKQAGELKGAATVVAVAGPYSGVSRELIDAAQRNLLLAVRLLGAAA
jgi:hypothetical protein